MREILFSGNNIVLGQSYVLARPDTGNAGLPIKTEHHDKKAIKQTNPRGYVDLLTGSQDNVKKRYYDSTSRSDR